ncbi:hypothetical protein H6504_04960 [Candidatus Woesearchaeota archaeon]|nr:hypothetical protein [Candidatus Woesearchaeota archaeon]
MKKRLTQSEEFEIMKMVMDKFLWLGTVIMGYGLFKMFTESDIANGIYFLVTGVIVLVLFVIIMVKEYEMVK